MSLCAQNSSLGIQFQISEDTALFRDRVRSATARAKKTAQRRREWEYLESRLDCQSHYGCSPSTNKT
jgi:hypothetical protein